MIGLDRSEAPSSTGAILAAEDVHVWQALLKPGSWRVRSLADILSPDERLRAGRFRFEEERGRFVLRRGLLRIILARYLEIEPEKVLITYGPFGKPAVANNCGGRQLFFNLSHSREVILYAVAYGREVGVDVEWLRPVPEAEQIAEQFFSPYENVVLRGLPTGKKQEAFLTCWTRKEAYAKARGEGLSIPLNRFAVSLTPGEPPRLLDSARHRGHSLWSLHALTPLAGYTAALAVRGHGARVTFAPWPT